SALDQIKVLSYVKFVTDRKEIQLPSLLTTAVAMPVIRNFREIRGYTNIQEQKILFITIVPDIAGGQNEKFRKAIEMRTALIQ
ncbi:unnamed protein product, partial [Bubo scandiacus]